MSKLRNAIAAFKVGVKDFKERERFAGVVPKYIHAAKKIPKKADTFEADLMRQWVKNTDSRINIERLQMAKEGIDYDKIKEAEKALMKGNDDE